MEERAGKDQTPGPQELERQLREANRRLEETQSLARVGTWEWDLVANRAVWSRELLRIFDRHPDGSPPSRSELLDAMHPDDRAGFEGLISRLEANPGRFDHSFRIVDGDGETLHMEAHGSVDLDERGRPIRVHGTTQDITELTESQAQLERARRLEAVGQLAGGVAHDFNNLLAVILNYAECAIDTCEDAETLKGLREIERAALSAADLTRQLLLFSRHHSDEPRPVDLAAAIAETEAMLRRAIGDHIELTASAPAGLPRVVLGDGQAEQILVNLVVNARDALVGGGAIEVTAQELKTESMRLPLPAELSPGVSYVVLSVADDGVGMAEDVAAQAFDPFFTTKPRGQGTGLGLATVYGIAGRVGGQVEIESEPGRGTIVSVYLPVAADGAAPERALPMSPAPPGEGRTVLVVDNEEAVRTIVARMLSRQGYQVHAAASGAEAEAVLTGSSAGIELLLTDVLMPGLSGRELVDRLRPRFPRLRTVYMSGYDAGGASPLGALEEGATILRKPFSREQLLRAVGEVLAEGKARR